VHYLNKVEIGNPSANGTSIAKEVSLQMELSLGWVEE
jgi:hypothetical protein